MKYIRQQYALLLIAGLTAGAPAQALNGAGNAGDPFVISTPADLEWFAQNVNSGTTYSAQHIQLTAHIDISHISWTPIGSSAVRPFSGHFNGGGHRITGLQADMGNADYAGLFGYVDNGTIDSVGVILHPNGVKGRNYVGGLAGYVHSTSVSAGADITACYVIGSVQGNTNVGGLAGGYNYLDNNSADRYIIACFAAGKVSGTANIGGLVGENRGYIQSSYSAAGVQGGAAVGGIAGLNKFRIDKCYAVGAVAGTADVGSVAGRNDGGSFASSFYDPAMTGSPHSIGTGIISGVIALTQGNRYIQDTYASWDFITIWAVRAGVSYPYFVWQSAPAAANVLYRDSVILNILRPADSITAYRGARMERLCAITPVQTAGSVPFALPCAADIGDTLYFVVWEQGRQPSPPVRAVVQRYPLAVGAGGNASSLYGNAIDTALCRRTGGILRQGHTLQCSAALDAPPDSLTPSGHIRTGIYKFVFYDKKVMAGGADVTHLYEITSAINYDTIKPRPLYVRPDTGQRKPYNSPDPRITYTNANIANWAQGDEAITTLNGALSRTAGEDAGAYRITAGTLKAPCCYKVQTDNPSSVFFTINKATAMPPALLTFSPDSAVYNGNEQPLVVSVQTEGASALNVIYLNEAGQSVRPVNAGTYRVRADIIGGRNYADQSAVEAPQRFVINKAGVSAALFRFTSVNVNYTGQPQRAEVALMDAITGVGQWQVWYHHPLLPPYTAGDTTPPADTGTYSVRVRTAEGQNYTAGTAMLGTLTIQRAVAPASAFTLTPTSVLYNGAPQGVSVQWRSPSPNASGGSTFRVFYSNALYPRTEAQPIAPAEYDITIDISAGSHYLAATDLYIGKFKIIPPIAARWRNSPLCDSIQGDSIVYTGRQIRPCVEVSDTLALSAARILRQDTDYTLSYGANTLKGEGRVEITGLGIYEGSRAVLTFRITAKIDNITALDSIVIKIPNDITINDSVFTGLNENNNEIRYALPCGESRVSVAIGTENPYAQVIRNGNVLPNDSFVINAGQYGDTQSEFKVISTSGGDTASYVIRLSKPIPFDSVVVMRWGRALTVINNPANNGGYRFRSFKWYKNDLPFSENQSIPDAHSGALDTSALYRVELVTEDGRHIGSCAARPSPFYTAPQAALTAYPNPVVQGGTLRVETGGIASALELYSIDGRLLHQRAVMGGAADMEMPFALGVYVLRAGRAAKVIVIK